MKSLLLITLFLAFNSLAPWETNFETAKKAAKQDHKLILLNFSGSDWCGPCIRMHEEIFGDVSFLKMAGDHLLMVNADFPRSKKRQLAPEIKKQNDMLADNYNKFGKFPFTVLLDPEGKVIKSWEGLPKEDAKAFANEIKQLCDANR